MAQMQAQRAQQAQEADSETFGPLPLSRLEVNNFIRLLTILYIHVASKVGDKRHIALI